MRVALGLLVILTLSCVIAFQPLPTQQYTIGTPREGHLAASFWSVESNAEGSYRWSNDQSRLRFFGYGSATSLDVALRLIGPYGSRGQRTTLQMSVGDTTLFEGESPEGWRTYHLLVPATGQGWETPEIRLGGTLTSSIAGDGRNVGVAISAVQVRPLLHQRPLAVAEYTAFIALVLVLIWAGLSLITRSTLALGTALGMGVALLVWIRLDPAGAAYLLPPLWGAGLLPAGVGALFWLNNRIAPQLRDRPVWLVVGLIIGLAGALLLRAHIWLLFGGGLLLAGALIAASALPAQNPIATNADALYGPRRWYGFALLACTLLALGLRFFQLGDIPFGVWRDEARHGLVALHILNDPNYRPVYVPQADIPALLFYLQTISIGLLGPTVSAVRAVPALAGSLTVLSIAYVGRQMWGRAAGAGVALMVAVSAWHIALSRLAFAAVLDPLLSLIALALLWRISGEQGSSRRRLLEGVAAGATLSLALYTYHPARLMPLAAAIWVALRLGINWQAWRRALPPLIATALAAGIVAAPLLLYWLTQASDFNQRVGQVSLLDRQDEQQSLVADLNHNLINYALMWHVTGDRNARHNIPGTPMLDPLSGLLFLIGLMLLLTDRRLHESLPLLALLGVGLIPGMLSSDAPHAVRTVDAIAPSLLIAAYAVVRMVPVVVRQPLPIQGGILCSAVAFVVLINAWGYLGRMPYDPRVWDAFHYTAETAIGQAIHDGACSGTALLPERPAQSEAVSYLAYGHSVEPFRIDSLPEHFPSGSCVFFPANFALEERAQVERVVAGTAKPQVLQYYPGTDLPVFLLYKIP